MEPTKKSEKVENLLTTLTKSVGVSTTRQDDINANRCRPAPIGCGRVIDPETEFRDALSVKEYRISGLCQKCQDTFFGGE